MTEAGEGPPAVADCQALGSSLAFGEALLEIAEAERHPIWLETHRATMTQDIERTPDLVERFPEMRFNGDFGHWRIGRALTYGDMEMKSRGCARSCRAPASCACGSPPTPSARSPPAIRRSCRRRAPSIPNDPPARAA